MEKWSTVWSYAQRSTEYTRWEKQNHFKINVRSNLYGSAIRLKYSNMYNRERIAVKEVFLCAVNLQKYENNLVRISEAFDISYKESKYSGIFSCDVTPDTTLEIQMVFATYKNPLTGNTFNGYLAMVLQSVEVLTDENPVTLACFGDSITHQGMWTEPMIRRLYQRYPGKVTAFEVGINGNRLLRDSPEYANTLGVSGLHRFEHDVLDICGITHVIVALGINDIGLPGNEKTSLAEFPAFEDMKKAYVQIAEMLKKRGIYSIAATITPRIWEGDFVAKREYLRMKINDWLINTRRFDCVLDFSSCLSRGGAGGLKEEYDSGDGIHINDKAGLKLQELINIKAFLD